MTIEHPPDDDCDFCQAEARLSVITADTDSIVYAARHPRSPGSVAVIPRSHRRSLTELAPEELRGLGRMVQRTVAAVEQAFDPVATHVFQNTGVAAGARAAHLHVWVIPRVVGSEYSFAPANELAPATADATEAVVAALRPLFEAGR